jgi:hypothetical protein
VEAYENGGIWGRYDFGAAGDEEGSTPEDGDLVDASVQIGAGVYTAFATSQVGEWKDTRPQG